MTSSEYIEILRDMRIDQLEVDNSILTSFHDENIYTIGDLLKKSNSELASIAERRNFSIQTVVESLQKKLSEIVVKDITGTKQSVSITVGKSDHKDANEVELKTTPIEVENEQEMRGLNESYLNAETNHLRSASSEDKDIEKDLLDISILDLDISSKTYYSLRFSYLETIRDIIPFSKVDLIKHHKRLDLDKLNEVDAAIKLVADQKCFEDYLEEYAFFSEPEKQCPISDQNVKSDDAQEVTTGADKEGDGLDVTREWNDDELLREYGQLYTCIQELLKDHYDNGSPIWISIPDLQTVLEERCPFLGEDLHNQDKITTILNNASWVSAVSFFYSWKPGTDLKPEEDSDKSMTLTDCVKEILAQRKEAGKEWVMAMTVYDILKESYPSVAKTAQLVDVRDVLTTTKGIEKDDIYFRITDKAYDEIESVVKTEKRETLAGETMQARIDTVRFVPIEELGLSVRSFNGLKRADINTVGDLVKMTPDELLRVRNLGALSKREIEDKLNYLLITYDVNSYFNGIADSDSALINEEEETPQQKVVNGIIVKDVPISQLGLSTRPYNILTRNGIKTVSEILCWTREDLLKLRNMGVGSANEILHKIQELYDSGQIVVDATEEELKEAKEEYYTSEAFLKGLRNSIILLLNKAGHVGLTYYDLNSGLSEVVEETYLLPVIEKLIKEGTITREDDRYKKIFPSILKAIEVLPEDHQQYIRGRLEGTTLEDLGKTAGVTRERIRQIVSKDIKALRNGNKHIAPVYGFSEDKYQYLYENYSISKAEWSNIFSEPEYIYFYLQIVFKRGMQNLKKALEDELVDNDIKRKIQASFDANYIIVGNKRIPKERKEIEDYVIYHYFKDEGTVGDFYNAYNSFLDENGIEDVSLYATDAVKRTRENRLSESRKVLWKQNRRLRYYDIDGTDFDELLDTLDLRQYENIELSTLKFIRDYPELMVEYDLRDEYELHNLLKKICDPAEYPNIDFGRMPGITFGYFDRESAVREMLFNLAPISQDDFAEAISQKYGFKVQTIKANWLNCVDEYYLNGEYHTEEEDDQLLTEEQFRTIQDFLCEDFYLWEEVKRLYSKAIGEKGVPKSYVLKKMGFKVYSDYILRGANNASEFFVKKLTEEDIIDLSSYGSKLRYIMTFSQVEYALREEYVILEFEPHKYVSIRRLNSFGMDKSDIVAYCNEVKKFVGENNYFTIPWLRKQGFTSKLDDLGFDDFFYEAILSLDQGIFSFIQRSEKRKGSSLLRVGNKLGSKVDFAISIIEREGSIDKDDLINYLINNYNLYISDYNLSKGIEDTDIYYDSIMEKYYANYSLYYEEI